MLRHTALLVMHQGFEASIWLVYKRILMVKNKRIVGTLTFWRRWVSKLLVEGGKCCSKSSNLQASRASHSVPLSEKFLIGSLCQKFQIRSNCSDYISLLKYMEMGKDQCRRWSRRLNLSLSTASRRMKATCACKEEAAWEEKLELTVRRAL